ncbi:MAG: integrase arm-type DNA-binding domain-containing protein [Moraxella sp.]|uniref:tyrosine-type recombinase/integrase n=1 Tax=Moraxella sp. TaxID=479 RepID=UPI0026DC041C|nr:integrase arm-type DNA-binding domain-containing protein [Moraxella sp.]MDO4450386.1 integrase arm-type DNA-binding domain-containing protein [Moraxella sp.]
MARQTLPLTSTQIDKAKPKDKLYRLYDGGGLILNITPTGGKYWYLQYKHPINQKSQMHKLGDYPTLSLADARKACQDCHKLLAQYIDPKTHFRQLKKERKRLAKNTFGWICAAWADKQNWKDNTAKRRQYRLNLFNERFGQTPIDKITTADLIDLLQDIERTHRQRNDPTKPSDMADRCRGHLIDIFAWATLHGYCKQNPMSDIANAKTSHVLTVVKYGNRKALVKPSEFAHLLKDIFDDNTMDSHTRHNMLLLAYTAVRNGDIRAMKWVDLDLDNGKWELIPIKGQSNSGIKMVEKMTVPLSRQVIKILQKQHELTGHLPHVFAKDTKDGYISDGATSTALKRLGYGGLHQSHGFRSSAKSILMGELDYSDLITEMMLGHQVKGDNPYMRADLYTKRCELMQTWADY